MSPDPKGSDSRRVLKMMTNERIIRIIRIMSAIDGDLLEHVGLGGLAIEAHIKVILRRLLILMIVQTY